MEDNKDQGPLASGSRVHLEAEAAAEPEQPALEPSNGPDPTGAEDEPVGPQESGLLGAMAEARKSVGAENERHQIVIATINLTQRHFIVSFPTNPPLSDEELLEVTQWITGKFHNDLHKWRNDAVASGRLAIATSMPSEKPPVRPS